LKHTGVAGGVALARKVDAALGGRERIRLRGKQLCIVAQPIERIGDLPEGLEHDLPVARGARRELIERRAAAGAEAASIEDRRSDARDERPSRIRAVEQLLEGQ